MIGDIKLNKWGYIIADEDGRTSDPRIWAGGDIVTGAATVILAMAPARLLRRASRGRSSGSEKTSGRS